MALQALSMMGAMNLFPRNKHINIHNSWGYLYLSYLSVDPKNPFFVILKSILFTLRQNYFNTVNAGNELSQQISLYI